MHSLDASPPIGPIPRPPRLDDYFALHYLDQAGLARACALEENTLAAWIDDGLIPAPSYVVTAGLMHAHVLGERPAPGASDGRYFHPDMAVWVERARQALTDFGPQDALARLHETFAHRMAEALAELDRRLWRLPDAFDDAGTPIADGLAVRIEGMWTEHQAGTYGLCVARPLGEREIAWKEIVQEKLRTLTDAGRRQDLHRIPGLAALIDDYDLAAMPFSPIEYPDSSRRTLIDDLRPRLAADA